MNQRLNESDLVAEAGQQSEIHIAGDARLAPSLDRDSADETGAPALTIGEILELFGRGEDLVHRFSFARYCCISTMPEVDRGGRLSAA